MYTASHMLLYNPMLQHSNKLLYSNRYNKLLYANILLHSVILYEQGDRPPATGGPPPMRIPGAARRTPRHYPRLCISCYYIVFFLFCHLCYSISAYPKTHKPRRRASDVSTISTCFLYVIIYCPLPHQSL